MRLVLFVMLFVFVASQVIVVQPSIAQIVPGNDTQQGMNQTISGDSAGQVSPFGNYTERYEMNSNGNMTNGYMMHNWNMTNGYMMHHFGNMTSGYMMNHFGNMTGGYMMHNFGNMTGNYGMNSGNMANQMMAIQPTPSPEQQIKLGIPPNSVSCTSGYSLVINSFDSRPACISSNDTAKFIARGWGHLSST
ncbi:MAG: hypothetical protein WBF38_03715 [Nitrosotalea sp.]